MQRYALWLCCRYATMVARATVPLASLQDDLLVQVFQCLPSPADLVPVELVCQRFRGVVSNHGLWQRACAAATPAPPPLVPAAGAAHSVPPKVLPDTAPLTAHQRSAFYKKLWHRITTPAAVESLIAEGIAASSTDHPIENIHNLLTPRVNGGFAYWSSAGSDRDDTCESLTFRLAHPLCRVDAVEFACFRAFFQEV